MAEWRTVAKQLALGDGHISQKEVQILRTAILADEKISKSELDFLHEVKKDAKTTVQALDELIADCEAKL